MGDEEVRSPQQWKMNFAVFTVPNLGSLRFADIRTLQTMPLLVETIQTLTLVADEGTMTDSEDWFVSIGGSTHGPYTEQQIRFGLQTGKVRDPMLVKKGSSKWTAASNVKLRFERLEKTGYFILAGESTAGPYTQEKIMAALSSGQLQKSHQIRKGKDGDWRPAKEFIEFATCHSGKEPETPRTRTVERTHVGEAVRSGGHSMTRWYRILGISLFCTGAIGIASYWLVFRTRPQTLFSPKSVVVEDASEASKELINNPAFEEILDTVKQLRFSDPVRHFGFEIVTLDTTLREFEQFYPNAVSADSFTLRAFPKSPQVTFSGKSKAKFCHINGAGKPYSSVDLMFDSDKLVAISITYEGDTLSRLGSQKTVLSKLQDMLGREHAKGATYSELARSKVLTSQAMKLPLSRAKAELQELVAAECVNDIETTFGKGC